MRWCIVLVVILVALVSCDDPFQGEPIEGDPPKVTKPQTNERSDPCVFNGYPITLHGGNIMPSVNIYVIWYGNWAGNTGPTILSTLLANLGASSWWGTNIGYYGADGHSLTQNVVYAGATTDAYSRGMYLTTTDALYSVYNALAAGKLPNDPNNGIFLVLASADVGGDGFCTAWCGYHSYFTLNIPNSPKYKFALVIDPTTQCLPSCAAQTVHSPNGNPGADAMASVISHELAEAATDPAFDGWYDAVGCENGDKCAWTFGSLFVTASGAYYNTIIGNRGFLIQQNFNNLIQSCEVAGTTGRVTTGRLTTGSQGQATTGRSTTGQATTGQATTGSVETSCQILNDDDSQLHFTIGSSGFSFAQYSFVSFANFSGNTGNVEGRLAVKNQFSVGYGYSIGSSVSSVAVNPNSLVVGGDATFLSGAISPYGSVAFVGGNFNAPAYLQSQRSSYSGNGILDSSFDSAQAFYTQRSVSLSQLSDNVQQQVQWSTLNLVCDSASDSQYVFTLAAATFSEFTSYSISGCNPTACWVINVPGTGSVQIAGGSFPVSNVVYNVLGSSRTIQVNTLLNGALLAPQNTLDQAGGLITGKVIVGNALNVLSQSA